MHLKIYPLPFVNLSSDSLSLVSRMDKRMTFFYPSLLLMVPKRHQSKEKTRFRANPFTVTVLLCFSSCANRSNVAGGRLRLKLMCAPKFISDSRKKPQSLDCYHQPGLQGKKGAFCLLHKYLIEGSTLFTYSSSQFVPGINPLLIWPFCIFIC